MRVLLLAAAAMATYEECHLYRSAVIARERGHRRLLPKPITSKPKKPKNSITFLVVSRARSGTDWLRAMLNDHRRVCMEDEAVNDIRALRAKLLRRESLEAVDRASDAILQTRLLNVATGNFWKHMRRNNDVLKCRCDSKHVVRRAAARPRRRRLADL